MFLQTFQRHLLALFIDDKHTPDAGEPDADATVAQPTTAAQANAPFGTPLALLPTTYPKRNGIETHAFFEHLRIYAESLLRRGSALVQAVTAALQQGLAAPTLDATAPVVCTAPPRHLSDAVLRWACTHTQSFERGRRWQ